MEGWSTAKRKLLAVDCLKALKETRTFRSLSKELKLPIGVINRYVNGYVLPREERATEIIDYFYTTYFDKMIDDLSLFPGSKFRVTISILTNNFLLNLIAHRVKENFESKVDKVLTAASDGIPLGVKVADYFGCRAIYAKNSQEISKGNVLTSRSMGGNAPRMIPYYLPDDLLLRRDDVLIVDDVIRTGGTIEALHDFCQQSKSRLVGISCIFITQSTMDELKDHYDCPVHAIKVLPDGQ